jgi:hypothetical protein
MSAHSPDVGLCHLRPRLRRESPPGRTKKAEIVDGIRFNQAKMKLLIWAQLSDLAGEVRELRDRPNRPPLVFSDRAHQDVEGDDFAQEIASH